MGYDRKILFIDKKFQTNFILKFSVIAVLSSLVIGVLIFAASGSFTTVTIENAQVNVKKTSDFILPIIVVSVLVAVIFSAVSVAMLTLISSHKIAGPLYRLKKEIENFGMGSLNANFHTRKDDQLQELTRALHEMGMEMSRRHGELKEKILEARECLHRSPDNKEALSKKLEELETLLNYFKI